MFYLITTENDSIEISNCLKADVVFDGVIFWDNSISAADIEAIGRDDSVVIAVRNSEIESFITTIIKQKGILEDNICYFYNVFKALIPFMRADRAMVNPYFESYEGLILGLSHAETGIISDNLCISAANLAISSQDLYYNYQTLKYVIDKYESKIKNLKYIVLDMYKYNYFNFDTSLSKMASVYWSVGGYNKIEHHFSDNHNFSCTFDELISYILKQQYGAIDEKAINRWCWFFTVDYKQLDPKYFVNIDWKGRNKVIEENSITTYDYNPNNVRKRFENTISENIDIFNKILRTINEFNPDIKVFVIQMPMYEQAWKNAEQYYGPWKEEFERIINDAKKNYGFSYYDWTQHELSFDKMNWYDTEHLNYIGAMRFTEVINSIISH